MKPILFSVRFLVIVLVGGAAIAGSVALIVPAGAGLKNATTPLGKLNLIITAPAARSVVYDRNGNIMTTLATQDRSPVKLRDVPQVLIDAVISVEDRKFYEHHGVDWAGSIRALTKNVDAGGISQGGSTITQQLVKNTLSLNRKRDLTTKVREAILAWRLENELSKNQILQDYLNLVYFGNGAYGVQAAAERYFNVPLKSLTLAQAALLAGLVQSPEGLNPIKHPGPAARRRSEVLDSMVQNGKISVAKARAAKSVPLPTKVTYPLAAPLDYYMDEVKNQLLSDDADVQGDPGEVLGSTQQSRANAVFRGGLRIYTAYDPGLQFAASASMKAILPVSPFTASLVVIDNADGGVRAIANGRSFAEMQFDPATEGPGRQAGSAFKVFTLATALSRGYSPNDLVSGDAITTRIGPGSGNDAYYNLSGDCHGGTPTLITAIAISDNCAWVRTELSLGPGNYGHDGANAVILTAKAMGIDTSHFGPYVSTTLGTNGVHPLEMAQAYSVFPNDGVLRRATFITKIVASNGKVIYQSPSVGVRVLDTNVARTETDMLKHVLRNGTASRNLANFPRPAAGKTGTTDKSQDAWFVGYTPQYTAAVWMGNPLGEIRMVINGSQVFGADYPAKIWRTFMLAATANLPPLDFAAPDRLLWPRPNFVTEFGRKSVAFPPLGFPPLTTPPGSTSPRTVPVVTTTLPTPATTTIPEVTTTVEPPPTTTIPGGP